MATGVDTDFKLQCCDLEQVPELSPLGGVESQHAGSACFHSQRPPIPGRRAHKGSLGTRPSLHVLQSIPFCPALSHSPPTGMLRG